MNPTLQDKPEADWATEFDKLWPNLYTIIPGLGQGDARRALKQFIAKQIAQAREEGYLQGVKRGAGEAADQIKKMF